MAWEDGALPFHRRLISTLFATFHPVESLHAVSNGNVGPALRFALLTTLPFMLLWAIPPFTHTLHFDVEFALSVLPEKSTLPVWLDIARAMGIGFVISAITILSWAVPFASLVRAFADGSRSEDPARAAWRSALYRCWILPFGTSAFYLVTWGLPKDPSPFLIELTLLSFQMLPRLVVLIHCHALARYFGTTGLSALACSVIPLAVELAVGAPVWRGAEYFLPPMPAR